jgi:co-chaperonin GroES (HSP10)
MNHRKLQPSGDHILIQYAEPASNPAAAPDKPASRARVIAVGPGKTGADGHTVPLGLKVGQKVFVDRTSGIKIRLNRQSYAVIRQHDLLKASA